MEPDNLLTAGVPVLMERSHDTSMEIDCHAGTQGQRQAALWAGAAPLRCAARREDSRWNGPLWARHRRLGTIVFALTTTGSLHPR